MTAEVDVHQHGDAACESEAASNGNVSVVLNENGISKDDGDGSYVFVTADDSDLSNVGHNGDQGQGQSSVVVVVVHNGDQGQSSSQSSSVGVVENNKSQLQSQSSLAEEAVESTKQCDPEETHHLQTEEDHQLRKEVPVQDDDDDDDDDDGDDDDDASMAKLDPESKEIGDELPACDTHDSSSSAEQYGSCDDNSQASTELHLVVNGTAAADKNVDAQESVSDPTIAEMVNETSEENGQILPANGVVDEQLEIQAVNATLSDKTGDGDDIKSAPEPIVVDTTEMNNGTYEEILVPEAVKPLETQIINGTVLDEDELSDVEVQKQLEKQIVVSDVTGDELLTTNALEERVSDSINTDPFIDTAGKNNGPCEEDGQILADTVEVEKQLETQIVVSDKTGDELLTINAHEESNSNPIVTACQILVGNAEVQVLETQVTNASSVSIITGEAYEGSISEPRVADTSEDTGSCENVEVLADSLETKKQLETQVVSDPVTDKNGDGFLIVHAHLESISEHIVTDDLDDTSAEMGSCEKSSVCENATVENGESLATVSNTDTMVNVKNEDSLPTENDSSSSIEDGTPQIDVEDSDVKSDNPNSIPHEHSKSEAESAQVRDVSFSSCPANDVTSEPNSISKIEDEITTVIDGSFSGCQANAGVTEPIPESITKSECDSEIVPVVDDTLPKTNHDATNVEIFLSNVENESDASPSISIAENNEKSASKISRSIENDATLPASSDADESLVTNDRHGSEVECTSAERSRGFAIDSDNNDSTLVNSLLNCISGDVQIESEVKLTSQEEEVESSDGVHTSDSTSKQEVPTVVSLEGQNKCVEIEKRPFYFLIRNPRNDDENLKEQIRQVQSHVEEKTKIRDAIRSKMQIQRATCKEHYSKFEAVVSEERAAQELLRSKRREIDSVQLMINKVKDALSIEDMANTIRHMEHSMAHETLPLKEEKQYIRDIKQLKQRRDQLAYSLGKQDEVQQALDQKDDIEQRIKDLRKEMDQLKVNLLKAQEVTQAAKKKYNGENDLLHKLQYEFEAADATRQEAYAHLQRLRKQIYEKTKHFWKYRKDAKAANVLALSGNKEQLQYLCLNQVGTVMELWKNDRDFRNEYIKCNTRSTLKRLRTADGRALGPDEAPPVIPDIVRVTKHNMAAVVSSPEPAKPVAVVETEESNDKSAVQVVEQDNAIAKAEQNNVTAKAKKPVIVASSATSPATVSGRDETEDERADDPRPIKEEEELARKEEELREEEAAARLREQRRQEEKAKAREAMERKKRIAEKAQARAAIKAQKEAEEKEKEREKRARKKERKKASATKATNGISEGESALELSSESSAETPPIESETTEKPLTVTKRSQKVPQFTKQTKVKSIPLPLRNRNKRRMQPWMWVLVTILSIFGLFMLGNGGGFSFQSMRERFF